MTHLRKKLIGALAAAIAFAWAGSAFAADPIGALGAGYTAADAPLGAPTELRVDLRGQVAARCDLTAPPAIGGRLDFGQAGQVQSSFAIDCNTPFILRVRSRHGAFAGVDPTPGVATETPYEVAVDVGTNAGRRSLGWCQSAALSDQPVGGCAFAPGAADGGWSSDDAIAIDQTGTVRLRWDAPDDSAPRLGSYGDIIVIELEVRA